MGVVKKGELNSKTFISSSLRRMTSTNGAQLKPAYRDHSAGQREGAIGHYASRLVSAFIAAGTIDGPDTAVTMFHTIVSGINEKFGK